MNFASSDILRNAGREDERLSVPGDVLLRRFEVPDVVAVGAEVAHGGGCP